MEAQQDDSDLSCDPTNARRYPVPGLASVKWTTDAPPEVNRQASAGRNASDDRKQTSNKISIRAHHRIGAWNVRGLLKPGKLSIVESELENHHLSILGISETHMRGNGHFTTRAGNTFYFSGADTTSAHGVGILIPSKINGSVLGYNPISDRIMTLKLNCKPCNVHIVQVYAPTAQASEEDIDRFYGLLEETLDKIPNREITLVLGDFNAKIGNTVADDHIRQVIGKHGLGVRNERGERLINFCVEKKLNVVNTNFQHHPRRLYTWKSPGDRYRNQIDFILINCRWKSSVKNAKTFPGAECGSDHNLLVAEFTLRMKKRKNPSAKPTLFEKQELLTFRNAIEATLAADPPSTVADSNTQWLKLKSHITTALDEVKSRRTLSSQRKKKNYITKDTWELIQQRKDLKIKGLQNPEIAQKYSTLCKRIDSQCRADKNSYIKGICSDIEENANKLHSSDLFKKVRLLAKKFTPKTWVIEDADGQVLHELDQIAERWREYCEHLYKNPEGTTYHHQTDWNSLILEPDILRTEVTAALRLLKLKKAPGLDVITAEILQSMGDKGIDALHMICSNIWRTGKWPDDWTESAIIPLHKKGSTKRCDNYRTLSLISHASKVLLHIINHRIRHFLDWQIPEEQAGFVKGRGTREHILNVRQLIEKAYEYDAPFIMCFVDYSKAFDCVNWEALWRVLTELGIPQHLVALLESLYVKSHGVAKVGTTTSRPFTFQKGVRQGCLLSPILFNAYGEYIVRHTLDGWEGGVSVGGAKLTNLRYADDTTLLAASETEMQLLLDRMELTSNDLGLQINRGKTKVMVVDRTNKLKLTGSLNLEVVNDFIYLGSSISNTGSCEQEIRRRIGMAKGAMGQLERIWKDRKITQNTKVMLVKTLVFSIFLYGAETWTLKSNDRRRVDAFEMWCWRRMLRIPWTAKRTNVSILKELKVTTRLSSICLQRVLEYFGHIARKDGGNLEKLVVTGKIEGKRPRGRSPIRWTDQIRTTLGCKFYEAIHKADNRSRWRKTVREIVIHGGGHDPQP